MGHGNGINGLLDKLVHFVFPWALVFLEHFHLHIYTQKILTGNNGEPAQFHFETLCSKWLKNNNKDSKITNITILRKYLT